MGSFWTARCKQCATVFRVHEGFGVAAMVLRCWRCGRERWLKFNDCSPSGMPWGDKNPGEWDPAVDSPSLVEPCPCGGGYSAKAKSRCPNCRSTKLEHLEGEGAWGSWD